MRFEVNNNRNKNSDRPLEETKQRQCIRTWTTNENQINEQQEQTKYRFDAIDKNDGGQYHIIKINKSPELIRFRVETYTSILNAKVPPDGIIQEFLELN
jgi:hypothetical protein